MTTLTKAQVKNFQSVADVTVNFGKFTVMVGPSNSGKSAFLRGVKACVRNSFVPANVRQGTNKSEIKLNFGDTTQVSIERGKSLSTYKLGEEVFTKSARGVPEDIEKALKFPLVSFIDPSFSFQFDKPFLLSETGTVASSVLGSLTNVSLLHSAIREANRRRQEASATLKIREEDVRKQQIQLESYLDLPAVKKNLQDLEDRFNQVKQDQQIIDGLTTAVGVVESSKKLLDSTDEILPSDKTEEILHLVELNQQLKSLIKATNNMTSLSEFLRNDVAEVKKVRSQIDLTASQYHDRLVLIGKCPTCGQATKALDKLNRV